MGIAQPYAPYTEEEVAVRDWKYNRCLIMTRGPAFKDNAVLDHYICAEIGSSVHLSSHPIDRRLMKGNRFLGIEMPAVLFQMSCIGVVFSSLATRSLAPLFFGSETGTIGRIGGLS